MNKFHSSVEIIAQNIAVDHTRSVQFNFDQGNRLDLLTKIENIVLQILQCLSDDAVPQYCRIKSRSDEKKIIAFDRETSRGKFATVTYILSKIYILLASNKRVTKRELYYENVVRLRNQGEIDRALHDICHLLKAPIWQLRVLGTAKGLIAGPLTFEIDGEVVTVDSSTGTIIPQNVIDITNISSPAKWILLVEKDAAFQKLIQDGGLNRLGPAIFVTGKGFPDVSTRMLIRRLWESLGIPVLALVDADPYGIDIMCVYRFGSQTMSLHSTELACPAVRWLGVHPTDIHRLKIENQRLTSEDVVKLKNMISRPYMAANTRLRREVEILLRGRVKAEMEGVSNFSPCYLTDTYIPSKILCHELI